MEWWVCWARQSITTHIITIQSKMYEATSRLDGIIVFSGFMLAVYRKGRFQLSITKLNQKTARKKEKKEKEGEWYLWVRQVLSIKNARFVLKSALCMLSASLTSP